MNGPRFRLKRETEVVSEDRQIVTLPAGAEVVLLEPLDSCEKNAQVALLWKGWKLEMFAVDLLARGKRVEGVAE